MTVKGNNEPAEYKNKVKKNLSYLNKILSLASTGDFSKNLRIPKQEDEFTELHVGIQLLIDVIREKIAELKKERNLIESEKDKLQTLIDNLPVGVSIIDAETGSTVLINQKGIEFFGHGIEGSKKPFVELFKSYKETGAPYPKDENPVAITLKKKRRSVKRDLFLNQGDGKHIIVKSESVPVFDKEGKMTSVIAVFDDITREKELDKLKSQFLSVASHQLRTPLGTTRWNLEMLLKGDYGSVNRKIKPVIEDIYESNKQLITLVNDLLNVSKIEDGRDFDRPEKVKLAELIRRTVKIIKPIAVNKGIGIRLNLNSTVEVFTIDKTKFENIVLNLLSNAVKYNFSGGKIILTTESDKKFIVLSVKDTGVGISEKDQERIFSKFYRTEDAIKLASEGTGLGLYMVKKYAELWGGKVLLKSKIGTGSEFKIKIPRKPKFNLQVKTR